MTLVNHPANVKNKELSGAQTQALFFNIYHSNNDGSVLYADDTVLVCVAETLEEHTDLVNNRLQNILGRF